MAQSDAAAHYLQYFPRFIQKGIEAELLDTKLAEFDLAASAAFPVAGGADVIAIAFRYEL